jgi:hypothetical protein
VLSKTAKVASVSLHLVLCATLRLRLRLRLRTAISPVFVPKCALPGPHLEADEERRSFFASLLHVPICQVYPDKSMRIISLKIPLGLLLSKLVPIANGNVGGHRGILVSIAAPTSWDLLNLQIRHGCSHHLQQEITLMRLEREVPLVFAQDSSPCAGFTYSKKVSSQVRRLN